MVLESLLLNTERRDNESPQYHVHHGPCCSSECTRLQDRQVEENAGINSNETLEENIRDPLSDAVSRKRRLSIHDQNHYDAAALRTHKKPRSESLPSQILDVVINTYFKTAHHWIPFLHEFRFRARYRNDAERAKLNIVLHAMTYIAIRLVPPNVILDIDADEIARISKEKVLMNAFDDLSVENLQALAMIAFDHVSYSSVDFCFC